MQGTDCHDINVTFISSPKDGFLELIKLKSWHVSSFSWIWKKDSNVH